MVDSWWGVEAVKVRRIWIELEDILVVTDRTVDLKELVCETMPGY